jgi:transcriptional regulator with XRE-family HTH domain
MGNDGKPGLVGQNILRLMQEQGREVTELARAAGLPQPSTLTEILKGRTRDPRVETQQRIAKALEVDPDDLTLTRAELADFERRLSDFEQSEEAKRLVPQFSHVDAARLRARRARVVRDRLPPRGIRQLVRALRSAAHETDHSD